MAFLVLHRDTWYHHIDGRGVVNNPARPPSAGKMDMGDDAKLH
jgi:hypothetical protein